MMSSVRVLKDFLLCRGGRRRERNPTSFRAIRNLPEAVEPKKGLAGVFPRKSVCTNNKRTNKPAIGICAETVGVGDTRVATEECQTVSLSVKSITMPREHLSLTDDHEGLGQEERRDWGSLPADIIRAITNVLSRSAAAQVVRSINRHWSEAARALISKIAVDTCCFTHHSQMGSYLGQLADSSYSNLRQLKLNSQFRDGYRQLNLLKKLTSLDVSGCAADTSQFSIIASLTNLTSLSVGQTGLTDEGTTYISSLKNLTSLNLEWCRITELSLPRLTGLSKLKRLNLRGLLASSVHCLEPLTALKELTFLDLSWIHLKDDALRPIAELTNLTNLNLTMNPLSCTAMSVVSGLTQLIELGLMKTNVGNEGLQSLTSLVRLRRLNLSGTAVEDHGLHVLTHLRLLSSLDLSENYMIGWNNLEHLMPLTSLVFLRRLFLQKTQANSTAARILANRFRTNRLRIEC